MVTISVYAAIPKIISELHLCAGCDKKETS